MGTYENSIVKFLGIKEDGNPLVIKPDSQLSVFASVLEGMRPITGQLEKMKSEEFHSSFDNVLSGIATFPSTLLRFKKHNRSDVLFATAWDQMLQYDGANWNPLLTTEVLSSHIPTVMMPSNKPYGAISTDAYKHVTYVNRAYDWFIYNDILWLTDGYNRPMKTDGTLVGQWGVKQLKGVTVISNALETAAGTLNGTYIYDVALYDSTRVIEGELSTNSMSQASGAGFDIWVYINHLNWGATDNYDFEDTYADKIRIYRNGATGSTDKYLLTTLDKGLKSYGTCTVTGSPGVSGTATIVETDSFATTSVDDVFYYYTGVVWLVARVSAIGVGALTLKDPDGTNFEVGNVGAGSEYKIYAGFLDSTLDITANTRHHSEDTTAEYPDHTVPENCKFCTIFNDRAFMAGDIDNPSRLYFSEIGIPDYFPIANYLDVDADDGDQITGLVVHEGKVLIFKQNSTAALVPVGDQLEFNVVSTFLSVGASDRRSIADCAGKLIFANTSGIWMLSGRTLKHISHNTKGSDISGLWKLVFRDDLTFAQAVYNRILDEYVISITFKDQRDLYDSSLTGLGTIFHSSTTVAEDNGGVPQNNICLIYRIQEEQWCVDPDLQNVTAWSYWDDDDDNFNGLFFGRRNRSVYKAFAQEARDGNISDSGDVSSGSGTTLVAAGTPAWTTNEWATATLWIYRQSTGLIESIAVASNTADTLTVAGFVYANPTSNDNYSLLLQNTAIPMVLKWTSQKMVFKGFRTLVQLVEATMRVFFTGDVTLSWQTDDRAGTMTFAANEATSYWGVVNGVIYEWDAVGGSDNDMIWSELDNLIKSTANFPDNAEGYTVQLSFDLESSQALELSMITVGYKINLNGRWRP